MKKINNFIFAATWSYKKVAHNLPKEGQDFNIVNIKSANIILLEVAPFIQIKSGPEKLSEFKTRIPYWSFKLAWPM